MYFLKLLAIGDGVVYESLIESVLFLLYFPYGRRILEITYNNVLHNNINLFYLFSDFSCCVSYPL